jgi:hypothetical protein
MQLKNIGERREKKTLAISIIAVFKIVMRSVMAVVVHTHP